DALLSRPGPWRDSQRVAGRFVAVRREAVCRAAGAGQLRDLEAAAHQLTVSLTSSRQEGVEELGVRSCSATSRLRSTMYRCWICADGMVRSLPHCGRTTDQRLGLIPGTG